MARRVFFSFHYQRDSWRVSQVRNSWLCRAGHEATPFLDGAQWEKIKRQGSRAIQNWIDRQMKGTSVTVVLIGQETANRPWVKYEIEQSAKLRKGIVGVRIHNLKNQLRQTDRPGPNPLDKIIVRRQTIWGGYQNVRVSQIANTYDYYLNNGRLNLSMWIEEAARNARR